MHGLEKAPALTEDAFELVFLLDESASMADPFLGSKRTKADALAFAVNATIYRLVLRSMPYGEERSPVLTRRPIMVNSVYPRMGRRGEISREACISRASSPSSSRRAGGMARERGRAWGSRASVWESKTAK